MHGKVLVAFLVLLWASATHAAQSSFPQFDGWFEKYRAAKLTDPEQNEAKLQKGLQELLAAGNQTAAQRALSLACFRFHADPRQEKEQYAAQRPWAVREKAVQTLGQFRDPETLRWLTTDVLLGKSPRGETERIAAARALGLSGHAPSLLGILAALGDESWQVRAAAADAAGHLGGAQASLAIARRLRQDEEASVRVRCLDALAASFDSRNSRFTALDRERVIASAIGCLADADWRVRVAACDFFSQRPDPKAVPALIETARAEKQALAQGSGRKRAFFAAIAALTRIAGKTVSANEPQLWQAWWEKNREGYTLPTQVTGTQLPAGIPHYFTIPVCTDRMVFLLDISGSMDGPGTASKLARAKQEIIGVIEKLGPRDRFNVVFFENAIYPVFDGTVPATAENVNTARQRILSATAGGGTNLFGALETALRIAQPNAATPFVTDADTVFLLSDGAPSSGLLTEPAAILASVATANASSRVAIHTIAFGTLSQDGSADEDWLKSLASRNFGEHRRIDLR